LITADVVIADVNSALASLLRTDARFKLAYEDHTAVVFEVRREVRRE